MSEKNLFKDNWDSIFKPVVVLLAICIIIPLALGLTNKVTKGPIAEQEQKQKEESMQALFPDASFEAIAGQDEDKIMLAAKDGQTLGYVVTTGANGYGGEVKVMTAILDDGTVKAIKILSVADETPGLGQNATKESFFGQFAGQPAEKLSITKDGGTIEPITGASITSRAVTNAVDEAIEIYQNVKGENGNEK